MTDWKTYKSQTPFQFIVAPSESYNEGNKIAFSPKIPGKSPVWGMDRSGIPITPTHTPCRYWTGEGWEWKTWSERICMGLEIDYDSTLMFADEQQVLGIKDGNGDVVDVDVAVWFLTGVGSINADIGSSITYTAPSEPLGTDTTVIEMWCGGVIRDTLTITFAGKIIYTTPQQPPGNTQDLPIDNPNPACEYTWELVGGGSLSVVNGVMRYTAPTTNPNCENNATISLLCNGVVIDTIKIAITVINDPWIAYYEESLCLEYCSPAGSGLHTKYYFTVIGYKCDGTVREGPLEYFIYAGGGDPGKECPVRLAILNAQCVTAYGLACCAAYETGLVHQFLTPNDSPGIHDNRTEAQKLAGCCPAQLM